MNTTKTHKRNNMSLPVALNKIESLIHLLLFNDTEEYEIDLSKYIDLTKRTEFREEMRKIVSLGGKQLTDDRIIHREDKTIWKIEIKLKK